MSQSTENSPARAELEPLLARAIDNAEAMNLEHGKFRTAQVTYASILARAAAGEEVPELEYEAAEHVLTAARQRVERRLAVARIQARAIQALMPAAVAETAQHTAAGQVAQ